MLISGNFEVLNVKGDEGAVGWGALSTFPNVKAEFGWANPAPELNVNPADGLGFSSGLPPKGSESPDVVPKLNGELVFPLLCPKLSTRPEKNESSFGRGVVTSTTLVGLSSILTSSSSLGGVTGRGKLPKSGLCASAVLEFVPNVNIPGLDVPCTDSPNCGVVGFSGELAGAPNLKANENAGFASFGASICTTTGGLVDSPGDGEGVDCSGVNGFGPSVALVGPNPGSCVPDEPPNENINGVSRFCSELVATGLDSIVEVVEGTRVVGISADSAEELWDGKSPGELGSG